MRRVELSRKQKSLLGVAIVVLLITAVFIIVFRQLSSPAVGTIKTSSSTETAAQITNEEPATYNGKVISFSYPAHYKIITSPKVANSLEIVKLYSTDHSSVSIAISITKEELSNDSGISFRLNHPDIYKKVRYSSADAAFTSSQNGSEETEYLAHDGLVASISMTTPGQRDLSEDFSVIIKSFEWK